MFDEFDRIAEPDERYAILVMPDLQPAALAHHHSDAAKIDDDRLNFLAP